MAFWRKIKPRICYAHNEVTNMLKTVTIDIIKKIFPSYFSADYVGQLNETKIKQILNMYSKKKVAEHLLQKNLN